MTLSPAVFKAYDVRGVVPDELDAEGAYRIARAYVQAFAPRRMAIGRDMRLTSPDLAGAAIEGALDAGADVVDIGLVGTEMLYFAVADGDLDGGLIVTASHNPAEYNGMKIVRRGALPVGGDSGLDQVRAAALADPPAAPARKRGTLTQRDVLPAFADKALSFIDPAAVRPLKVVLDGANGMAGTMLQPILPRLPIQAVPCFMEPDGRFPDHQPNPLLEENREFIVGKVRSEGADLGIAWDGDADRCFFVDDAGEFVPGDFVTALLAETLLERHPGGTVIYDLRASRAVPETVERMGGRAVKSRVGHAFIKHRIREEGAVFAGEVSGHYYFGDFYGVDTGIVPALLMLELVSRRGGSLAALLQPLRERYHISGEINSRVDDVAVKLQELKDRFGPGAEISHLDGVSIDFPDWHFNVRPSNTEPLLRLNLEAFSAEEMERRRDEVLGVIRGTP
jgi:phosphomannomutase